MAILCRCLEKHSWPSKKYGEYIGYVKPVEYPNTSIICGNENCNNPAVIWIDESGVKNYQNGERLFHLHTNVLKIKADESGVSRKKF